MSSNVDLEKRVNDDADYIPLNQCQPYHWFFTQVPYPWRIVINVIIFLLAFGFFTASVAYLNTYSLYMAHYGQQYSQHFGGFLAGGIIMLILGLFFGTVYALGVVYRYERISCFPEPTN